MPLSDQVKNPWANMCKHCLDALPLMGVVSLGKKRCRGRLIWPENQAAGACLTVLRLDMELLTELRELGLEASI